MHDITILGPLNLDLVIHGSAPIDMEALVDWSGTTDVTMLMAGAIGYFTGISASLGRTVEVISTMADDPLAGTITRTLKTLGIDTKHVSVQPGTRTAIAIYMLLFGSKKRPLTYRLPTHDLWPLKFTDEHFKLVEQGKWLHHGGYLHFKPAWDGSITTLFKHARQNGIGTSLDPQFPLFDYPKPWRPALVDLIPLVDVLFVDSTEATSIENMEDPVEAAKVLLDRGAGTVVLKQGSMGSTVFTRETGYGDEITIISQEAGKIDRIVDSIGAGDSFDAGYIDALLDGNDPGSCLANATKVATRTLASVGGQFNNPGNHAR